MTVSTTRGSLISKPSIIWFRQDLRLVDQPALLAAAREGPVIPVYILDDSRPGQWRMGSAQRWWLHESLESLASGLSQIGLRLILRRGDVASVLAQMMAETQAQRIYCMRHNEPWWIAAENALARSFDVRRYEGTTLCPVGQIRSSSAGPFRKFTPFWRSLEAFMPPPAPQPAPTHGDGPEKWPQSDALDDWGLKPTKPDWAKAFADIWTPGEPDARERLGMFGEQVGSYDARRDFPSDAEGTSLLSPHLHFGEISPSTVWHGVERRGAAPFLRELAWRDFAQEMMVEHPNLGEENGQAKFNALPWREGAQADDDFRAWCEGRTGFPIIDAGMRQLWSTGWMHNRVRMITASFLVKHLLLDWRRGARWFWDTLVDADYANNSLNWQWVAGTGIDASPFFRIMAPLLQSEKFAAGDYIRRWVPELRNVPDNAIHDPHRSELCCASYPEMIVGHREGRERALAAWRALPRKSD